MTSRAKNLVSVFFWWSFLLACFAGVAVGQSSDIAWPSPVRSTEIRATIPARDLGDPRLTDHYYAFTGVPGDVLITVDSRNLNGDVDVFTFSGLRPLLKFTVYAGSSSPITKGIYLRQREDLILRIEGRTPNDDEAVYRIHFGGAFEPITSGPLAEHEDALQLERPAEASNKTGRRVSSVGARVEEPRTEVAEAPAPTPEPTPEVSALPEPKVPAARSTTRNSRRRVPAARKRPAASVKSAKPDEAAKKEVEETSSAETSATETARVPKPPATKSRRARRPATPAAIPESDSSGPRLIIETSDGTLVDRFMGSVRRVTVENGQVIVIGKDGTIQRVPLASVVRMTIAP